MSDAIEKAALRLREASETHKPCAPIRDLIDPGDVAAAYAVQELNTKYWLGRGRKLVGRKIGLTAVAVQKQLGVDQPDFGLLFADMRAAEDRAIPFAETMQPKVEAEVALILKAPLTRAQHTVADIAAATDYASAAIEIVGSRIANWDIKLADTIADNASSSHFVLGARHVRLSEVDLAACAMSMTRRGETVSTGSGAACMGNPLNAAVWLADAMVKYGRPLQAGDVIMTGALGPMAAVEPGDTVEAKIEGLGTVRASFGR
ncbi:MAG TPA: fumarylacetoacetate hydrolase family protein [Stellaceae bacterium]|nr:fumarylacetoacetate hydrolase family protein [Stellaceae bacterium]